MRLIISFFLSLFVCSNAFALNVPTVNDTIETKYVDIATNPSTGSAWTSAQIDSISAGVMAQNNAPRLTQVYIEVFYQ